MYVPYVRMYVCTYVLVQEPKDKKKVRSPLIVEFGNPVDQNVHSCYNRFWPGDISRKAQETQN